MVTAWRTECVRRRVFFDLQRKREKLHLLQGLGKILLDIDKAIAIIRNTEREADVVPNLMDGFGIDRVQAEYVGRDQAAQHQPASTSSSARRRTEELERDIAGLEATLNSRKKLQNVIIRELEGVIKKYAEPRRTGIVYSDELPEPRRTRARRTTPCMSSSPVRAI